MPKPIKKRRYDIDEVLRSQDRRIANLEMAFHHVRNILNAHDDELKAVKKKDSLIITP